MMIKATEQKTIAVAQKAFEHFSEGLTTGKWQPFLDMLSEDFHFWFPVGKFSGLNVGQERAKEFFQYVAQAYSEGLEITLERIKSNDTTVVFEFRDQGLMWGQPYKNRVAVSFDIRGDKICAYREYFGSNGQWN